MRTNAPEEFLHEVDGGASALLESFIGEGPAVVSSRSSFSSVSRDEEYELGTRGGTATFLNFFWWRLRPAEVLFEIHLLEILIAAKVRQFRPGAIINFIEVVMVLLH